MKNESNEHGTTVENGESATPTTCGTTTESEERWLPVVGYEGRYEASNFGRVRSIRRSRIHVLSPAYSSSGYLCVALSVDGRQSVRLIHHLVLEAFAGRRPTGMDACHNDGDPFNNAISNLRWATKKENMLDRKIHGRNYDRTGEKNGRAVLSESSVIDILRRLSLGDSVSTLAANHGVHYSTIRGIKNITTWKHIPREEFDPQ
jgi:hypothetical protein